MRALMPCVLAGVQALTPIGSGGLETANVSEALLAPTPVEGIQRHPTTQLTYADYRRRLMEARTDVEIGTVAAVQQKTTQRLVQLPG